MLYVTIMQSHATETHDSRVNSHLLYTNIGAGTDDQRAINTRPHTLSIRNEHLDSVADLIVQFSSVQFSSVQ